MPQTKDSFHFRISASSLRDILSILSAWYRQRGLRMAPRQKRCRSGLGTKSFCNGGNL